MQEVSGSIPLGSTNPPFAAVNLRHTESQGHFRGSKMLLCGGAQALHEPFYAVFRARDGAGSPYLPGLGGVPAQARTYTPANWQTGRSDDPVTDPLGGQSASPSMSSGKTGRVTWT